MPTYDWLTAAGLELPTGTTPLAQNALMLGTFTGGQTIKRIRAQIQLTVAFVGSAGNQTNFGVFNDTHAAAGIILFDTASPPATTPTPLTDPNGTGGQHGWAVWEPLYPSVVAFDPITVETGVVHMDTAYKLVDSESRRKTTPGHTPSLWLAWEINDAGGLINNSVGGVTYALGARWAVRWLVETSP